MSHKLAKVSSKSHAETGGNVIPTGYKQTDVGIIPADWRCEEIAEFRPFVTSGSRGWAAYYSKYGSPFVRITNMMRTSIYLDLSDTKYVSLPENASEGNRTSLENGDVLVSITADIGISSYVDGRLDKPAFINQHIALVRFNSLDIDSKFVAYYLSSEPVQNLFRSGSDQGAKAGMNLEGIRRIKIAVPSKKEQTAIAHALSDVDALISELEKLIAKKQAIKTATMQQLLTGKKRLPQFAKNEDSTQKGYKKSELGEIPEDWDIKTVFDLADNQKSQFDDGDWIEAEHITDKGVRLIQTGNIGIGRYVEKENKKFIFERSFEKLKCKQLRAGDLLICRLAEPAGRACILPDIGEQKIITSVDVTIFRPREEVAHREFYLQYFSFSEWFKNVLEQVGGTTHKRISRGSLGRIKVIYPKLEEQVAIAEILSDMDSDIQALEQRLSKTRQIKQGMMQELLTGKTRLVKPESK